MSSDSTLTITRGRRLLSAFGLVMVMGLTACGGDDGGVFDSDGGGSGSGGDSDSESSSTTATPNGTWRGNLEDAGSGMHTTTVTISGGQITSILIDGTDQGVTGTVTREQGDFWIYELSDGTTGGFIFDDEFEHATFVDQDTNIGVIEKGASSLPSFNQTDIALTASGTVVNLTGSFEVESVGSSSISCDGSGNCNGNDSLVGDFTVSSLALSGDGLGRWLGQFNNNVPESGVARAFVTADKGFAGSWMCPDTATSFIGGCSFHAWRAE